MNQKRKLPIVYSCSGASSAAQMANHIAVRLDRLKIAEMSCIAGVGGDVPPLVRTAKSGRPIIALDGCPLHCAAHILKRHGLTADKHYDLNKLAVKKRKHEDFDPQEATRVLQQILDDPQLPIRRPEAETASSELPPDGADQAEECREYASPPCYLAEFAEPAPTGTGTA